MERTAARAKALSIAGLVQWVLGGKADVRPLLEEALDIATEIGDQPNIAWSRVFLGAVISTHGDYLEVISLIEQGLEECRALGSAGQYGVGFALSFLGDDAFYQGDYQRAQELYEKSADVLREVRDQNFLAYALCRFGHTARYLDDLEEAEEKYLESLSLNMKLGHKQGVAACISALACVELASSNAVTAVHLFAAVEKQLEKIGFSILPADTIEYEKNVALAQENLSDETFAAAWAEGRSMTTDQAVGLALKRSAHEI